MCRITCKDCGRHYDYDQDDFCPKCGSYNPPRDESSTSLERELLARFGTGRENQARAQGQQRARQAGSAPASTPPMVPTRTAPPRPTPHQPPRRVPGVATEPGFRPHGQRVEDCRACGPETDVPKSRMGLAVAIVVIVLIVAAVAGNFAVSWFLSGGSVPVPTAGRFPGLQAGSTSVSVALPDRETGGEYALGETFSVNDVEISVDEVRWVDLSSDPRAAREGYDCLAADVWITGGARRSDLYIDTPRIVLPDGSDYPLDDDMFLSKRLAAFGLYDVSLSDYQWEDPLYGQFVFFLPAGTAGEAALVIREYAPGDVESPALIGTHTVRLTLP